MESFPLIETLQQWWQALYQAGTWWQLVLLALAATGAALLHRYLTHGLLASVKPDSCDLRHLALRTLHRLTFPISMVLLLLAGRTILRAQSLPTPLLDVAVPLLLSLAAVRFVVYLLRKAFTPSPLVKASENLIAGAIWVVVAFHLLGWLAPISAALDSFALQVGQLRVSLLSVIKLVLLVGLLFTTAAWLSRLAERRLSSAPHLSPAMRVGLAKVAKVALLLTASLVALETVGIDLTALTVFGGALGVGIGFGLQRIASNFISGFILIFDRSIRPGDVISVGTKFGWVQELHARYVVVRDRDGVETLIPNENLITTEVINWSYTDPNVRLKIPVSVSYGDDPEQAMAIMLEVASEHPRVLKEPAPACRLMEFGDNGILLEVRVWVADPEEGLGSVRSDINLGIWRRFKEAGITIPFPQRDVHLIPN